MAGIINTGKVLNNAWIQGTAESSSPGSIAIDPSMEKQYDYALTSDPILLQERKDTQEKLYEIFKESPWFEKYGGNIGPNGVPVPKKIDKNVQHNGTTFQTPTQRYVFVLTHIVNVRKKHCAK